MLGSRFAYRLRSLAWLMLALACFFGGMRAERWLARRKAQELVFYADGFPYPLVDLRPAP
jgi:hypothetical protein